MQSLLNRNTDGPDNPLSQVFSRGSAQRMFWQFKNLKTEIMFWNPNWLPGIGKLLPRSVEDRLASLWGWHLWIYAQKRHLEFTGLKQVPSQSISMSTARSQFLPRRSSTEMDDGVRSTSCWGRVTSRVDVTMP
jgi:hypothetical protein